MLRTFTVSCKAIFFHKNQIQLVPSLSCYIRPYEKIIKLKMKTDKNERKTHKNEKKTDKNERKTDYLHRVEKMQNPSSFEKF